MSTTIDIEDDVLVAIGELARSQNVSAGFIVSKLIKKALSGHAQGQVSGNPVAGFRPFPARGALVTNEQVHALRGQEGV